MKQSHWQAEAGNRHHKLWQHLLKIAILVVILYGIIFM